MLKKSDYNKLTDLELVKLTRSGDRRAFDCLVIRYKGKAMAIAMSMLKNEDSAYEATQEAFFKAFRAIDTFNGTSFNAWFIAILKNQARDMLRKAKHRKTSDYDDERLSIKTKEHATEDEVLTEEYIELVYEALDSLSSKHKEPMRLYAIEGLSYDLIAKKLSIPVGTVMSRIYHARKKIKEFVENKQKAPWR